MFCYGFYVMLRLLGNTFFEYIHLVTSKWHKIQYKTQINNTFEVDKIYFTLGSNLHVFRESTIFPYIAGMAAKLVYS